MEFKLPIKTKFFFGYLLLAIRRTGIQSRKGPKEKLQGLERQVWSQYRVFLYSDGKIFHFFVDELEMEILLPQSGH